MALANEFEKMSDLIKLEGGAPLENIKNLARQYLPQGWQEWQVAKPFTTGELNVDAQRMNKLRYALPTLGLAKSFNPEAKSLSEKSYRRYKEDMLRWPFCRGLIIGPPDLAMEIRGSSLQYELVRQAVLPLKPLLLSRKEASILLSKELSEEDSMTSSNDEEEKENAKGRKRGRLPSVLDEPSTSKKTRMEELEMRQARIEAMLEGLVEQKGSGDFRSEEYCSEGDSHTTSERSVSPSSEWKAPRLSWEGVDNFYFEPQTKEQEPSIPDPLPEIKEQGIKCQKFGETAWNKIRYADAQKKLQAGSIFCSLQVNPHLNHLTPRGNAPVTLTKLDSTFGILCHGLLLQRRAFQESISEVASKNPNIAEELRRKFADSNSNFKSVSDDLLQFVCGKRAEIIESRRKLYEPTNNIVAAQMLRDIPPSVTHLFEEKQLKQLCLQSDNNSRSIFRYRKPGSAYYPRTSGYAINRNVKNSFSGKSQNENKQRKFKYTPK